MEKITFTLTAFDNFLQKLSRMSLLKKVGSAIIFLMMFLATAIGIDNGWDEFYEKRLSWIIIGSEANPKDFKWSKSDSLKFQDNIELQIGKSSSTDRLINSFRFTKADNENWILLPSVQLTLLRNPQVLSNEKEVFELKNKDFTQGREKRIEIVIFEPNTFSVKDNIQWLITIYKIAGADLLEPNFDKGQYKADVFYETKCNFEEIYDFSKCVRRGFIDVYKEGDRLFIIHSWIERNVRDNRSPMISSDVIDIMKSFEIIKK